jgi:hypothetical protein
MYFSNRYINSYQSNLLGMNEDSAMSDEPDHLILNDYVLLNLHVYSLNQSAAAFDLSDFTFKVDIKTNHAISHDGKRTF